MAKALFLEDLPIIGKYIRDLLANKVDKVEGKNLSTNDYTTEEKTKLEALSNDYDNLTNKPSINGVTLTGNKTTEDLIPIGDGLNINADGELEATGGGGTKDYEALDNKPSINGVTLSGNKTSADLGLMDHYDIDEKPTEDSENLITSGGVWSADKRIKDRLQGSKTAGSTDGSPFEIPDYGMTESIQMYFKPTQDLHGYDKPWAGGAGKNKLPLVLADIKSANTSGTWSGNTYTLNGVTFEVLTDSADNVLGVKVNGTASANILYFTIATNISVTESSIYSWGSTYSWNNQGVVCEAYDGTNSYAPTEINGISIPTGTYTVRFAMSVSKSLDNYSFYPMIRLSTETDPTFAPYSNICPISGQNNATFEWTGKNKIDDEYSEEYTNTVKLGAGTYYYQAFVSDTSNINTRLQYSKDGTNWNTVGSTPYSDTGISVAGWDGGWSASGTYTATIETTTPLYFRVWKVNEVLENRRLSISDTELTAYQRYIHGEVSMNFGNTYYGGFCQFNGQIYPDWDYIASYNGETLSGEWVSDRDEYQVGTTPTIGAEVAYKTTPSYVRVTPPANLNLTDDYPIEYNGYMASISYQPKNTVLAEAKKYTNQEIAKLGLPTPPTTDGTYHLECSVSSGIPTIRWVSNS